MSDQIPPPGLGDAAAHEAESAPANVLSFNASEATGAGGVGGDIATFAAMGAHGLPVVATLVMRDTAEVFDQHVIDADAVAEQARTVLEDISISAWKVGFLGSAENVSAVAEILSDYPDVPLVAYMPAVGWMDEDEQTAYVDAYRELILPSAEVLVGNQKTLTDFLLPDWEGERPPSTRELAVAALLASGAELPSAVSEALSFLDQSLDAGFRPGMGHVVPDRFFWAVPPEDEEGDGDEPFGGPGGLEDSGTARGPKRMH
jgi:hydroxymethylpyrimidine/phosphomethylpyrimidine kinase